MENPRALTPDQLRDGLNAWPPFAAQRLVVEEIAADWTHAAVRMDLTPENANFFGTAFGGTLFSMVDPFVVILAAQQLGPAYAVWDKQVEIDFLRPGTGPVTARVEMPAEEVERLREEAREGAPVLRVFTVDLAAEDGTPVARQRRTLYVRRLDPAPEV